MDNGYQLIDLLDRKRLQQLQDSFAKAFGMGFITVDYRGHPVIEYSGFTDFCHKIREWDERRDLCYQCDAHGGLHAAITGQPYIYRCHAGLVDFAVPLILQGKYMGAVMGGQVELVGAAPELRPILSQCTKWDNDPELTEASGRVYRTSFEKITAGVHLIQDIMQSMMEDNYHKVTATELEERKRELREEKYVRLHLEKQIENYSTSSAQKYMNSDFMFYVLNVIARLAYREHATETEHAVCNLAGMIRYIVENRESAFVTIGEELEYIEYYLQIQKYHLDGRLICEINVPDDCHGVLCPCMMLQPLVENCIKYGVESSDDVGVLSVTGRSEGGFFVLAVRDNGSGMPRHQIAEILDPSGLTRKDSKNLTSLNRLLKKLFGGDCGISIRSKEDGFAGTEVQVRLPLTSCAVV